MKKFLLLALTITFAFAASADIQSPVNKKKMTAEEIMAELDVDGSDTISKKEAKANKKVKKAFKTADANGDGELDMAELKTALEKTKKKKKKTEE